jgi:hypothetical protein
MLLECERISGLGNIHGPELSGPRVDVLEDVVMDGLEMLCIETAADRLMFELSKTACRGFRFELA